MRRDPPTASPAGRTAVPEIAGRAAWAAMLALGATLGGCNFAPHYDPPATPSPVGFKEAVGDGADQGWKLADPKDSQAGERWWGVYGDPDLDALESQVAISNQTVIAAEANYRAARALVTEAQASLYPTLELAPSATRSRSSASVSSVAGVSNLSNNIGTGTGTGAGAGTGAATGTTTGSTTSSGTVNALGATRTIYSLPLEASYQLDLWGSVRNTVAQDRFTALASAAQVATALLSTQTQLAQAYFELRITDEQRRVLDSTLLDYRASLHLVQILFNNGLASDEDLADAEAQLASAEASSTDLGVARAQYEHAIAVLVGLAPAQYALPARQFQQVLPVVPVGVPSDLLERRADIASAERQVAAANAGIGIARAAYFPTLTLSASGGYESTAIKTLIEGPNRFWSVGPQLAQVLFDGGARRAEVKRARALDDAAAATYRQTVLGAFQAVEDNLAALRILAMELKQQHAAASAAERAVHLSLVRFQNGVDSYVNVITAQNLFLTNRETELQVQLKQLTASVNLINALGGGWNTSRWDATESTSQNPPADVDAAARATDHAPANPPPLPPAPRPANPSPTNPMPEP